MKPPINHVFGRPTDEVGDPFFSHGIISYKAPYKGVKVIIGRAAHQHHPTSMYIINEYQTLLEEVNSTLSTPNGTVETSRVFLVELSAQPMESEDNGVDVSKFLLIEYSADSEMDSAADVVSESQEPCHSLDDDDAESCVCDFYGDCLGWEGELQEWPPGIGRADDGVYCIPKSRGIGCEGCRSEAEVLGFASEEEVGGVEEKEGEAETTWEEDDGGLRNQETNAMEDRLFWETCIAVGYPIN